MGIVVHCWTDGSGMATGGAIGWAYVLRALDIDSGEVLKEVEAAGGDTEGTNNRAELTAVVEGLTALKSKAHVVVISDSEYVLNGFRQGWVARWKANRWLNKEGDPVKNRDLWEVLDAAQAFHTVEWRHVKGHLKHVACSCGWTGDKVKGKRKYECPECEGVAKLTPTHPFNERCDVLAGEQRLKFKEAAAA